MVSWPHDPGPVVRQHIVVEGHTGAKPLTSSARKQNREQEPGSHSPLCGNTPDDLRTSHKVPTKKGSTTSQESHLGSSFLTHGPLKIQTMVLVHSGAHPLPSLYIDQNECRLKPGL